MRTTPPPRDGVTGQGILAGMVNKVQVREEPGGGGGLGGGRGGRGGRTAATKHPHVNPQLPTASPLSRTTPGAAPSAASETFAADAATVLGVLPLDAPKRYARCKCDRRGRQAEVVELLLTPADRRARNPLILLRHVCVNARPWFGRLGQLRTLCHTVLTVLLEAPFHAQAAGHGVAAVLAALLQRRRLGGGRADARRLVEEEAHKPEEEEDATHHHLAVGAAQVGAAGPA